MQKQEKLSDEGDLWHNLGGVAVQIITQRFKYPPWLRAKILSRAGI